ncbi:hypothetical protein ASF44_02465 [Pseudorhodoferax sp. Leaf274]|nr:hypothetical protein ASF44_02465 [Pseudorhodoferax sp. Leaf274]
MAAAAALAFSTVSAAPITQWDYIVDSTFDASKTTFAAGRASSSGTVAPSNLEISWGVTGGTVGQNRSGLRISNTPSAGVLATDGASQLANTYTHINNGNLGNNSVSLLKTQINAQLQLRPKDSGLPFASFASDYTINFAETPNTPGSCVVVSAVACDDIFVLSGALNESFVYDGFEYFVSFFAAPTLTSLAPAVCAAAGAGPNCVGFTTEEFRSTSVNFNLAITSRAIEIPEPGSVALLGLGLIGVAAVRRRPRG